MLESSREAFRRLQPLGHYALLSTRVLSWVCAQMGDREMAHTLVEQDLLDARAAGNTRIEAQTLGQMGYSAIDDGRLGDAAPLVAPGVPHEARAGRPHGSRRRPLRVRAPAGRGRPPGRCDRGAGSVPRHVRGDRRRDPSIRPARSRRAHGPNPRGAGRRETTNRPRSAAAPSPTTRSTPSSTSSLPPSPDQGRAAGASGGRRRPAPQRCCTATSGRSPSPTIAPMGLTANLAPIRPSPCPPFPPGATHSHAGRSPWPLVPPRANPGKHRRPPQPIHTELPPIHIDSTRVTQRDRRRHHILCTREPRYHQMLWFWP